MQRVAEKSKTWLKDELEHFKAEWEKEQKARQDEAQLSFVLGCFVPWLHIREFAATKYHL